MFQVDDAALYKDIEELISLDSITLKNNSDIGELQFRFNFFLFNLNSLSNLYLLFNFEGFILY